MPFRRVIDQRTFYDVDSDRHGRESRLPMMVVLLHAMIVGTSGRLSLVDLKRLWAAVGLRPVRTWIASGKVICDTPLDKDVFKRRLDPGSRRTSATGEIVVRIAAALAGIPLHDLPWRAGIRVKQHRGQAPDPDIPT